MTKTKKPKHADKKVICAICNQKVLRETTVGIPIGFACKTHIGIE